MSAPPDLVALGFEEKRHLEDYVLGACLIGDRQDREAAYKWLIGTDFTGPFRAELFEAMRELDAAGDDAAGDDWILPDLWRAACARSGCRVELADFAALEDDVATAALLPRYARRLRDLSLELEADKLHEQALQEGDPEGLIAQRLAEIAELRRKLRDV